ncbi:MAG: DUF3299 domain-containing protein [Endozoicomonas sp.]
MALLVWTALSFPQESTAAPIKPKPPEKTPSTRKAKEIKWEDLMPPPDPQVVERYQAGKMDQMEVIKYLDTLGKQSIAELNKTYAKMPGYLVPLNMDAKQMATELLLVPTIGACVHVPPPPPNQIVYIKYDRGLKVTEAAYTPYWVTGTLTVEKNKSQYSEALYAITVDNIVEFE